MSRAIQLIKERLTVEETEFFKRRLKCLSTAYKIKGKTLRWVFEKKTCYEHVRIYKEAAENAYKKFTKEELELKL